MASLILFASILALAIFCNGDLIDDICSQSTRISPTSCAETLRSDPHSRGADLLGLGKIAVKKAKAATKDTATVARSILDRDNSSSVRACIDSCGSAIYALTTASKILAGELDDHTKYDLKVKISAAVTFVGTCDDDYAEGDPPEVKEATTFARGLIVVGLIIGSML